MEDIMQFLVIAGIIAIGIYRQFSKEKAKNAESERHVPIPEYNPEYETDAPIIQEIPRKSSPKKQKSSLPQEGVRVTPNPRLHSSSDIAAAPPVEETVAPESEFSIHSIEEARRAIIWSEILQRKY